MKYFIDVEVLRPRLPARGPLGLLDFALQALRPFDPQFLCDSARWGLSGDAVALAYSRSDCMRELLFCIALLRVRNIVV